jgi:hypothetical protein
MSEPLDSLVAGWKRHFAAADATIEWGGASEALELELAPGVWLVGEVDAWGRTAPDVNNPNGELFFGEWKTANPREKKTWKQVWRMNPQSLSYGVLAAARWPGMRRFTVRKAFKENVPTYDHAWYRYSEAELTHWQLQLLHAADRIRSLGKYYPWQTNFSRCFKYGQNYACPFFEVACNRQQWLAVPAGADHVMSEKRNAVMQRDPNAIVFSPTSFADWLDCEEMFRRKYVDLVRLPKTEALKLGGDFHNELSKFYQGMVK